MTCPADPTAALRALRVRLQAVAAGGLRPAFEETLHPASATDYRRHFSIVDAGDALVEIPAGEFPRHAPHPYAALGATYPGHSPYHCRAAILGRLRSAQQQLRDVRPGWSIQIFDAYRPLVVQRFMVDREFERLARQRGHAPADVPGGLAEELWREVFSIWARPTADAAMPPPHSTGAALDVTLVDERGEPFDAGSAIDAFGRVSLPNHFAGRGDDRSRRAHANRSLLCRVMAAAGFQRHPFEWWHFSYGDQLWALMCWLDAPGNHPTALFGAAT